jgi:hypothetical protein
VTDSAIDKEIANWQKFSYSLRKDNREMFEKMVSEAKAYSDAFDNAPANESTEALLLTLILRQQEIIAILKDEISKLEKHEK